MGKEQVVVQLRDVFRQHGYEGASLSKIAEATGLGRASLYHYFPKGKEQMAATVLDFVTVELQENLLKPLKGKEDPIIRVKVMGETLDRFYHSGEASCFMDILSLGEARGLFKTPLRQTLTALIEALAQLLIEVGQERGEARQRAEDAIMQIQGALVLSRCLDNTESFQRVIANLPKTLGLNPLPKS